MDAATIHAADCRCSACRGGRAGPARRVTARRIWNEVCIIAALAAFFLVPGRWLIATVLSL